MICGGSGRHSRRFDEPLRPAAPVRRAAAAGLCALRRCGRALHGRGAHLSRQHCQCFGPGGGRGGADLQRLSARAIRRSSDRRGARTSASARRRSAAALGATSPALGPTREHQQRWQRTAEAWRRMVDAQRRLQRLWSDALREAAAAFAAQSRAAASGRQSAPRRCASSTTPGSTARKRPTRARPTARRSAARWPTS